MSKPRAKAKRLLVDNRVAALATLIAGNHYRNSR